MSIQYIKTVTDLYESLGYASYKWVVNTDKPPFKPLAKPLSECRVGLVASGGIYAIGQKAFHYKDDISFRMIPKSIQTQDLRITHFAYDMSDAKKDPNTVFPIDALKMLVKEGVIGELGDHFLTFMGGIYSARKVRDSLAPRITERLLAERIDAVILVPV